MLEHKTFNLYTVQKLLPLVLVCDTKYLHIQEGKAVKVKEFWGFMSQEGFLRTELFCF
jgi:hypothetical protein